MTVSPGRPLYSFEHQLGVGERDIDQLGHVNNTVYVRWMEEVAAAHWRSMTEPHHLEETAWVVIRHEIDYLHAALPGDILTGWTWIGEISAVRCERFIEISRPRDGKTLLRTRSLWCAVDPRTLRPKRIGPELQSRFHQFAPPRPSI